MSWNWFKEARGQTEEEKLRDKLAKQYYGMPYRDLCLTRQEVINKEVNQQLKDAPK